MAQQRVVVPDGYLGVWRRTLLTTAGNGVVDTATEVRWLQTPSAFGDVRIPKELISQHDAGGTPLGERDAAALAALAPQWGFAGHTVVTDDLCQWHREARARGGVVGAARTRRITRMCVRARTGKGHERGRGRACARPSSCVR
jgi:hypothetical protein